MKTQFKISFLSSFSAMALVFAGLPQQTVAQRFTHSNFGGGNRATVSRPTENVSRAPQNVSRPAPPVSRPAQVVSRPAEAPVINRSINGGGQNIGNHDFNRNITVRTPPASAPVRANVPRSVPNHENVNVYHANNQSYHAYAYHPFHPYYWGQNWHPIGYLAASLAADAYLFSLANQQYYYDDGVYYEPSSGGYSVVPAPIGATVSSLPTGYETTMVGNDYYYYYGGAFYIDTGTNYQVVAAPVGAVVTQIPDGAVEQQINGQDYLVYNNTYYQPITENGQDAYEVVQAPQ